MSSINEPYAASVPSHATPSINEPPAPQALPVAKKKKVVDEFKPLR